MPTNHPKSTNQSQENSAKNSGKNASSAVRKPRARFAPEYEILLHKLIAARRSSGITQGEMATALGKTQSHISMCENRERELSIMDVWKWCLALGINWSDLVIELEQEVVPSIGVEPSGNTEDKG